MKKLGETGRETDEIGGRLGKGKRLDENAGRDVPLVWENPDNLPMFFANQYVCQFSQDEFILTLGQMAPPMLLGDEESRIAQLQHIDNVPVKPLTRIVLTYSRLVELINVLEANRWQYEQAQRERGQQTGGEGA